MAEFRAWFGCVRFVAWTKSEFLEKRRDAEVLGVIAGRTDATADVAVPDCRRIE